MTALDDLVALLDLRTIDAQRFRSVQVRTDRTRLYGGQLVAQALMAAGRTVAPDRAVHSLHAYFLKAGTPAETIEFVVEPMRDSATFTSCRVVAEQHGRALLSLEASFHAPEVGPEVDEPVPDVAGPETMVVIDDWKLAGAATDQDTTLPYFVDALEFRQARDSLPDATAGGQHAPVRDVWLRAVGALPASPLLHACVLAYASDKPLLGTTVLAPPVSADPRHHLIASLDHTMWFHRPFRVDEWMLFRFHSSATGQGRAFVRAEGFRADGALAATAAQQGLVRPLTAT